MNFFDNPNSLIKRHIGISDDELPQMLDMIGVTSLDELISQTIPESIRIKKVLELPPPITESELLTELKNILDENQLFKTYIGMGYYGTNVPSVILRNIFENPGWYTQYTPYQAEISQGRLEALINFQTMIADLTALPIANASLLDEGTAAAESMSMLFAARKLNKKNAIKFFVSDKCFPQTIDVLITRSAPLGIELVIGDYEQVSLNEEFFGLLVQYPDERGSIHDYEEFFNEANQKGIYTVTAADLLSLVLLKPPGEFGSDVCIGSTQRFGVPIGYGGPHAAYFSCKDEFKRLIPGRIIGISVDAHGNRAYRMALQTREQHIKREKATSNICTSQVLLAIMASMYAVYHGPAGLRNIAERINNLTALLNSKLREIGFEQINEKYFDTLQIKAENNLLKKIRNLSETEKINFRYFNDSTIGISLDETTGLNDVRNILNIFLRSVGKENISAEVFALVSYCDFGKLKRASHFLMQPVFNSYHSETEMMRYIKSLENKDLSLTQSMIPLGSCTMKLNAAAEMLLLSYSKASDLHPFCPIEQAKGYQEIFRRINNYLCSITGLDAVSLQPNSGAQGEYSGLMVIREYFKNCGEENRNIVLIPASAHGTNPASAVMAGMKVVIIKTHRNGDIDMEDLKQKASQHKNDLAAFMVTYPSTHGVYENSIKEACHIIHDCGGQVYMDGANLNAQIGLTNPAEIGADVCHLNLHKTFAIPHGGGGPGMGPIAVAKHLEPFLPGHPIIKTGGEKAIHAVSSAPWGSPLIILISYAYIRMMGADGLKYASEIAILNANYLKACLEKFYKVLYTGENNRVAHELIFDMREFKKSAGVDVEDIAKRLMDYTFHAPTVSFPVPGTLMVEPTESESKKELDRFCRAMINIKKEIEEIINKSADDKDNVLKNAPHTPAHISEDVWTHPYSRKKAAYPLPELKNYKFWPAVGRIDNAYGDRNFVCTCGSPEEYQNL